MQRCVIPVAAHTLAACPAVGHADHADHVALVAHVVPADLAGHAHRVDRVDHMVHVLIVVNPVVSQIFADPLDVSISGETIVAYTSHEKCVCEPCVYIIGVSKMLQTPNILKFRNNKCYRKIEYKQTHCAE